MSIEFNEFNRIIFIRIVISAHQLQSRAAACRTRGSHPMQPGIVYLTAGRGSMYQYTLDHLRVITYIEYDLPCSRVPYRSFSRIPILTKVVTPNIRTGEHAFIYNGRPAHGQTQGSNCLVEVLIISSIIRRSLKLIRPTKINSIVSGNQLALTLVLVLFLYIYICI